MRKLSIIVFLMFSLLLCGMTQAFSIDITSPGDPVKGIPDVVGGWPDGEPPPYVIDNNVNTKYLYFNGGSNITGFAVTPSLGGLAVTGLTFTTANDSPGRDPVTFELYGSNGSIDDPFTELIASGDIVDFSQPAEWPRLTKTTTPIPIVSTPYAHYQVLFTAVRAPGEHMQIAEVELLTDVTPPAGWAYKDIGTTGGYAWEDAGTIIITADGADIGDTSDSFGYLYRPLNNNGSLEVNVAETGNAEQWMVGPMIRQTLDGGSKHGMTALTGTNDIQFVRRLDLGGSSYDTVRPGHSPPKVLRIMRIDNEVISEYWGQWMPGAPFAWSEIGRQIIMMDADVTIGIAVCAGNTGAINTAVLDNVVLIALPVEYPWAMSPGDGAEDVPLTTALTWMAGDSATSHDVYVSTDSADMGTPVNTTVPSYSPTLVANTTYYWQVIEQPGDVAGPVFSFTTEYDPPWYTGTLNWERWHGMWWPEIVRMIDSIIYLEQPPDLVDEVPDAYSGDTPQGDYGVRMSGHVIPGKSGDYTFWIAADDGCRLRLNTSDTEVCDLAKIAGWYRFSGNFDAWPELMSEPISLVGGQKYAIEILLKEAGGGDWVEVAWEGPDTDYNRTRITGTFLTAAYAVNAKPGIRANVTPLDAETLSWTAGKYATSQEVLFGTSPGAMASIATLSADPTVIVERSTLPMPAVASGNTYYWQVISTDGTDTWEGDVWSFTVSDWVGRDIGIERIAEDQPEPPAGSSTYDEGTDITVINAGGHELWGDHDAFHYRYMKVNMVHDVGTIQARVLSITPQESWRRAGVMIRENLGISSTKFMMHKTGHDNTRIQFRDYWRAGTGNGPDSWDLGFPTWVRIERDGDRFDGYYSLDGENWIHKGTRWIAMEPGQPVYIGLAGCHHPGQPQADLTTATFDNFSYTTPDPLQSWNLNPPSGATAVNIHATLTWGAGEGTPEHYVYFSSNEQAVVDRDPMILTILPTETTELYVGPLVLGEVYYWVVDEVSSPETRGEVASFTAEEYRILDDFEAYDIPPEAIPEQVFVPGEVLVEALAPPEQVEVEAAYTVTAQEPPEQICIDPGVEVEPGYTIPGYTIPGYTIPAIAPPGCLLGEWTFEGNYDDTSGSGFNGTPVGNANIVVDATRGNVLSLDGDLDYVDCGNPAALNFTTGNWALSAWTKTTMSGGGDENKGSIIANGQDATPGHRYCLIISEQSEGKVNLVIDDNADDGIGSSYNKKQFTAETAINDDVWHHTLGVRDGTKLLIYTDGVLEKSIDIAADYNLVGTVQSNVLIGAIGKASDNSIYKTFAGLIDDARIYNCALTEENARFLAEVGDLVVDPIEVPPVEVPPVMEGAVYEPLLLHYEFEDNALDTSGNQHNGTLVQGSSNSRWPTYTSGKVGRAMKFYDDGEHVLDDDSEDYMDGLSALTISCWIKSNKTGRDEGWVHFGTDWSDKRSFRYDSKGGSSKELRDVIKYGVATDDGNEEDESSGELQTKNWQHVAMTWQRNVGIKLYVDGVLDQPAWDSGAKDGVLEGYSQLLVGRGSKDNSDDESWNGLVDDLRIYNTVLSYGQVRYLADEMDDLDVPPGYGPMIAGYDFEGNANDSSDNNFHGTLIGDASIVDGALNLDGNGDCVDLGADNRFNPGAGPFSISVWINMSSWGGNWGNIIIGNRGEGGRGWQLRRRGGDLRLTFTTRGCGADDPGGNIEPSLGEWHHIAAVRDGTSKRLYIDGVLDNNAGINTNPITMAGHNVYIGGRATKDNRGTEGHFNGLIDNVRLYNLAFTENELRYLAEMGNLQLPDKFRPMLLRLEFEGNLEDSSGNESHGTPHGTIGFEDDRGGQVLSLPGGDNQYVSIPPVSIFGNMQTTIACWAKADHTSIPDWTLIFGFTGNAGGGGGGGTHFNIGSLGGPGGVGAHVWGWEATIFSDEEALDWRHYAMTYDGWTIKSYGDGIQVGETGYNLAPRADRVHVGKRVTQASSFPGKVDDARIYDYPLNLGQIRKLAAYAPTPDILNAWSGRAAAVPVLEWKEPAHEGNQSMRVSYTGSGAVSRLEPFGDGKHPHGWNGDFSLGQAQALSLWFRGDRNNAPGTMFAQLTTVVPSGHIQRVMYDGPPEDLQNPNWQEWTMSLKALSTGKPADPVGEMGLPITKIKDVGIGIIGAGGGTLYFDDLRLYPARCVPKYIESAYDLTDDCVVDREDMAVIARAWLAEEGGNGLWYEYYEGNWNPAPYFPSLPLVTQGTADNFSVGPRLQDDYFGLRFTGIVMAPVGGDYTFYTESDDGSKLYIDGTQVVDNDWNHGMQWREGTISLDAGEHMIEVIMYEIGGGEGLNVDVAGPGIPRMRIPNEVLFLAPGIPADLNGDGIVNFLDYADILNHFGDEVPLFPPPGEQL